METTANYMIFSKKLLLKLLVVCRRKFLTKYLSSNDLYVYVLYAFDPILPVPACFNKGPSAFVCRDNNLHLTTMDLVNFPL